MKVLINPLKNIGLPEQTGLTEGEIQSDPSMVKHLLSACPVAAETPLVDSKPLAEQFSVQSIHIKDERQRMKLGSFKALGAAFAIAKKAHQAIGDNVLEKTHASKALEGQIFVTASAGNHGLSVAAGARVFGAKAVIYLAETVPSAFADQLRSYDAEVVIAGADYEASMEAAAEGAKACGGVLLSDSTWEGYDEGIHVMEGYLMMASEVVDRYAAESIAPPTHVFLQAGVGGLAASVLCHLRACWGDDFTACVVEPESAAALQRSIALGKPICADGPVSVMGRLDCKIPSHIALKSLALQADAFMTLSDEAVTDAIKCLESFDLGTSTSGGAGFAGLSMARPGGDLHLNEKSRVLIFLSEGPA